MNSETKENGLSLPHSPSYSTAMALKRRYKKIAQMKVTKNTSRGDVPSPSTSSQHTPSNATKPPGSSSLSFFPHLHRPQQHPRGDADGDDMTIQSLTSQRSMKERMKKLGRPFKPLRKLGSMVGSNKSPNNGKDTKNYKNNKFLHKNKVRPTKSGHTPFSMKMMMAKNRNSNGRNETGSEKSPILEPPVEVVSKSTIKKKKLVTGGLPLAVSKPLCSLESLPTKLPSSIPESISFVTSSKKNSSNSKHDRSDKKITSDESTVLSNPYLWTFVALAVVWWKFGSMGVVAAFGMCVMITRIGNPGVRDFLTSFCNGDGKMFDATCY